MLWNKLLFLLKMAPEGGGEGGSGGGAADILDGGEGGDGGGEGAGGEGKGGETPPGEGGAKGPVIPDNWKDLLPEAERNAGVMANIKTVEHLHKALINAQKLVGADKIAIPGKNATPEQMREIYEKLGLPKVEGEYKITLSEGVKVPDEFLKEFTKMAFEGGIMPAQAAKMVEWLSGKDKADNEKAVKARDAAIAADTAKLTREWGEAYNEELATAKAGLRDLLKDMPKEAAEYIKRLGLQSDYVFIKMMSKYGKTLSEDQIRGEGGGTGRLTPDTAKAEIAKIKAKGAYFDASHPDHATDKAEVNRLYAYAFPGPAKQTKPVRD